MRITVDIDESQLARIQTATGVKKKSPAIRSVVDGYVMELEKKRFLRKVLRGGSDYGLTNEQLEAFGIYDAD